MKTVHALFIVMGVFLTSQLTAQENEPKKYSNPEWYQVVHVDYKAGKEDAARKIINDYFKKASDKAGTSKPVMELALNTGDYDYLYIWKLEEGLQSLDWEISPQGLKWQKAFEEMVGGKDKAKELGDEYSSYVSKVKVELARKDN
ncbi:hypothetical protein [Salinimicrobium soli]|uniref:hypothetical protein n=1 Tax=Salinimicrobium soli TaxID=1254399 RepID=UPI003AAF62AD